MYEQTDWESVGELITQHIGDYTQIDTKDQLDEVVERFTGATADAVENQTPLANPCPYSKRWFTPELKEKQRQYNKARRKWQASTARLSREHHTTQDLLSLMKSRRKEWAKAIERAKSQHWKDFLDRAAEGNLLWKAAKYAEPGTEYANIPPLRAGEQQATESEDKAKLLME